MNIRQRTAPLREKRQESLTAWFGPLQALLREARDSGLIARVRTFAQDSHSDLTRALELLSTLQNVAIVVHGPAGCANGLYQYPDSQLPWAVSNISERDSILGGDAKLTATIRQLYAQTAASTIIVVTSPVVVINNDDIETVIENLSDELGITLLAVLSDGFRSKVAATGYDVVSHALLKALLLQRNTPAVADIPAGKYINLLTVRDNTQNVLALQNLLAELAIDSQPFPRFYNWQSPYSPAQASLSVTLDGGDADYAALWLEEYSGLPWINPPVPIGFAATRRWLLAVAQSLGLTTQAQALIDRQHIYWDKNRQAAKDLQGRKIFIHAAAGHAISLWHFAQELALEVVAIKVPFLDKQHLTALHQLAESQPDLSILVGEGQAFEEIALLQSTPPDLYLSLGVDALPAARLGIASLALDNLHFMGFDGGLRLIKQITHQLKHRQLPQFLAAGDSKPYQQSWLKKSAHWYIKHEVK
jgi:nitrogenase molybdenum-cofactor synthesis protein NifE